MGNICRRDRHSRRRRNAPTLLVGLAEASFGSVPEIGFGGESGNYRSRLAFFFAGRLSRRMS